MIINNKNYLLLERRGCEYSKNETRIDDIGNYRVGAYANRIQAKNGRAYIIEFTGNEYRKIRYENKRTGAKLKKPVVEVLMNNALFINTEFEQIVPGEKYLSSWRDSKLERDFYNAGPVPYCRASILNFVNSISIEKYDDILFI